MFRKSLAAPTLPAEVEKLQGEWVVFRCETVGGRAFDAADVAELVEFEPSPPGGGGGVGKVKPTTITYLGNRFAVKSGNKVTHAGAFRIVDERSNPKKVDYLCTEGPLKGELLQAIYSLEGEIHEFRAAKEDKGRPKDFSKESYGTHHILVKQK